MESGGCPFKHFDRENLTKLLKGEALSADAVETVLTLVEEKDWSFACSQVYEEKKKQVLHQTDQVAVFQSIKSKCGSKRDSKDVESETLSENGRKRLKGIFEQSGSGFQDNSCNNGDVTHCRRSTEETLPWDSGISILSDTRSEACIESPTKRQKLDRTSCVGNECYYDDGPASTVASKIGGASCKIENGSSGKGSHGASLGQEIKFHKSLPKYSSEFITSHKHLEPKCLEFTKTKFEGNVDGKVEQVAQSCCNDAADNTKTKGFELRISGGDTEKTSSLETESLFRTTAVKERGTKSDSKKDLGELFYKPTDFYRSYKSLLRGLRK